MKLLFRNLYHEEIVPLKKKIDKILKALLGNDDDPFSNSFLIL